MRYGLSEEQRKIILQTIRQQGTLSLAAHNAGLTPSALKAAIAEDELFSEAVSDAIDLFKDAIRLTVLERATTGKSDAMLKLAAEAFVPESFKQAVIDPKIKQRPSVLTVRSFDENGEEVSHNPQPADERQQASTEKTPVKITVIEFDESEPEPANNEPPRLDYYRGL